mmetsp:Transcript_97042/g.274231  ORF Transcript_97042/g.274231 Transcript_97042/m.274231 type:complete len:240 (-) Transcript_97042:595-1314(-)
MPSAAARSSCGHAWPLARACWYSLSAHQGSCAVLDRCPSRSQGRPSSSQWDVAGRFGSSGHSNQARKPRAMAVIVHSPACCSTPSRVSHAPLSQGARPARAPSAHAPPRPRPRRAAVGREPLPPCARHAPRPTGTSQVLEVRPRFRRGLSTLACDLRVQPRSPTSTEVMRHTVRKPMSLCPRPTSAWANPSSTHVNATATATRARRANPGGMALMQCAVAAALVFALQEPRRRCLQPHE